MVEAVPDQKTYAARARVASQGSRSLPRTASGCHTDCCAQNANVPMNTPKIKTIRKITIAMKNSTLAIDFAPEETPLKPKKPATTDIRKKMMAHFSMLAPRNG